MRHAALLLLLGAGCVPTESYDLPSFEPGDSMLIVTRDPGGNASMYAFDNPEAAPPVSLRADSQILALRYRQRSLEELVLEEGPVSLDPGQSTGRPLTAGYELFRAEGPQFEFDQVAEDQATGLLDQLLGPLPLAETANCEGSSQACEVYNGNGLDTSCEAPCLPPLARAPEPPRPPMPPDFSGCPTTWQPMVVVTATACAPLPRVGLCDAGQAQFPSTPRCQSLSECPATIFAQGLNNAIYVDPTANAGGDGSVAAPYQDVEAALLAAADGQTVALSKGSHTLNTARTSLERVVLQGACAELTELNYAGTGSVSMDSVSLADLHLIGTNAAFETEGTANITNVQITARAPLRQRGGAVTIDRLRTIGGVDGAIWVYGGDMTATQVSVEQALGAGVGQGEWVSETGNSQVSFTDVFVDTVPDNDVAEVGRPFDGHAFLSYGSQATLTVAEAHILRPQEDHIVTIDSNAILSDLFLEGNRNNNAGWGIRTSRASAVDQKVTAVRVVGIGVRNGAFAEANATLEIEDFVFDQPGLNGIGVALAGRMIAKRGQIDRASTGFQFNTASGANRDNPSVTVEDLRITNSGEHGINDDGLTEFLSTADTPDTQPKPAFFKATRMEVINSQSMGVRIRFVDPTGSTWRDIRVDGAGERGIHTNLGALNLSRVSVTRAQDAGIHMEHHFMGRLGGALSIESTWDDVFVQGGLRGVWMTGLNTTVNRLEVTGAESLGVFVMGSIVNFNNLKIEDTGSERLIDLSGVPQGVATQAAIRDQTREAFPGGMTYHKCIGSLDIERQPGSALQVCGYRAGSGSDYGLYDGDARLMNSNIINATQGMYVISFAFGTVRDTYFEGISDTGISLGQGLDPEDAIGGGVRFFQVPRALTVE